MAPLAVHSLGMGLTSAPATESIMGAVQTDEGGIGSAVNDATREVRGTLGIAAVRGRPSSAVSRWRTNRRPGGLQVSARSARCVTVALATGMVLTAAPAVSAADRPTYIRPSAPGGQSQVISATSITVPRAAPYTEEEAHFVRHMMIHHGQAVTMAALVPDRAADPRIDTIAQQIDITQAGELEFMARWLRLRGEVVPDPFDTTGHETMPGMVSHEEMMALEAAEGAEFDVRFLRAMIAHHQGAVIMAQELEESTGGVMEPNISVLVEETIDHQETEIKRMQLLLSELSA